MMAVAYVAFLWCISVGCSLLCQSACMYTLYSVVTRNLLMEDECCVILYGQLLHDGRPATLFMHELYMSQIGILLTAVLSSLPAIRLQL